MEKRFRATITGKVQGVYYRASAREKAMSLELTGFVRNLPNGSVEIEAEGDDLRLLDLLRWCQKGPPGARVEQVAVEWLSDLSGSEGFSIQP